MSREVRALLRCTNKHDAMREDTQLEPASELACLLPVAAHLVQLAQDCSDTAKVGKTVSACNNLTECNHVRAASVGTHSPTTHLFQTAGPQSGYPVPVYRVDLNERSAVM